MASNIGASVYQKLKTVAKSQSVDMSVLLRRYAQERLLYRLSVSPVAKDFCLKGGLLLTAYNKGNLLRPTEDVDFNGFRKGATVGTLREALLVVLATPVPDDGVLFDPASMVIEKDREGTISGGKIKMVAKVFTARVEVRVDVGFGNRITPNARLLEMPTILEGVAPRPTVLAYPLETVVSEKLHAMAMFGAANTRLKDYFDIWMLTNEHPFGSSALVDAISATFEGQERPIPEMPFAALSREFVEDRRSSWSVFMRKIGESGELALDTVVRDVAEFAWPIVEGARIGEDPGLDWQPGAGWQPAVVLLPSTRGL